MKLKNFCETASWKKNRLRSPSAKILRSRPTEITQEVIPGRQNRQNGLPMERKGIEPSTSALRTRRLGNPLKTMRRLPRGTRKTPIRWQSSAAYIMRRSRQLAPIP